MKIISEHHLVTASRNSTHFKIVADSLKPYLLTQGNWCVRPLFLAGELKLPAHNTFSGFVLKSSNIITENEEKLILTSFAHQPYAKNNNCIIFDPQLEPLTITRKSDSLTFDILTLDGKSAVGGQALILGVALVQVSL